MKIFAPSLVFPQLVRGSHVCDDLELVQSDSSLTSSFRSWVGLAAIAAFAVNDDPCAGAVRAQDPIFEVEGFLLGRHFLFFILERSPALHAVTTFLRNIGSTGTAGFSGDFLMTVRAFHGGYQLFLDVFT
jgi:hypothetical protein